MKFTILILAISSLFIVGGASAQQQKKRSKNKQTNPATMPAASEGTVYEPDAEMLRDLQAKVRVVESKKGWTKFNRQPNLPNPASTRRAYIAEFAIPENKKNLMDVIVVHDLKTDKFYEIRGIEDFPWRPLSDFKWISNDVLQFEQWVNPSNGGRYQVNLKTGKLVAAGYVRSN